MKGKINEIGDTENGMYAIGQVAGRAYDRMLNSPRNKKSDGIVALDPKYGKVAQDAAYAGAGGYMQWRKKFKEKNRREPSYEEYRAWMQNYDNGVNDYGKPESERKGVVKLSESQLRSVIAESVKKVLKERFVPNGESEYNDENWNNEQENIMCFDLFAGSSFGLSDDERSEILTATLFDRYDKAVGRLNDFHVKYDADTNRLIGSV